MSSTHIASAVPRLVLATTIVMAGAVVAEDTLREEASRLFGRIESKSSSAVTPEAELGRALFWDMRISSDGKTACGSCHAASDWGADARRFSPDARGKPTS